MSKRILFFILFSWLASAAFPAFAQQKTDTVYTFRFVPQKDMFYVPWNGNGQELTRLLECIESNMDKAYRSIPSVCLSKHGYADETQDRYAGVRKNNCGSGPKQHRGSCLAAAEKDS